MRAILGSVLFVAIAICGLSAKADPQDDAVALVEKLKGKTLPKGKVSIIDLGRKKVTDNDLKVIAGAKGVRELVLSGTPLPKKDKSGKTLYAPSGITDEGLKSIAQMTELRKLTLDGANVTDAGLANLAPLKNLTDLTLTGTKVTDAGMEALTKLPKLQTVSVFDTKVTSSGEGTLKRWKSDIKVGR